MSKNPTLVRKAQKREAWRRVHRFRDSKRLRCVAEEDAGADGDTDARSPSPPVPTSTEWTVVEVPSPRPPPTLWRRIVTFFLWRG